MPKTIVSHLRPHLDEVAAAWMLKKYDPGCRDAVMEFIPTGVNGGKDLVQPDKIYLGVGRGQFDEHQGIDNECAASLVFRHLLAQKAQIPELELRGLAKLVEYVKEGDLGLLHKMPYNTFSPYAILDNHRRVTGSDQSVMDLGFTICDDLLASQTNLAVLEEDWAGRTEFTSIYGPAVALRSSAREIDSFGYMHGFDLVVYISRQNNYHNVRAWAGSRIDLTPIYLQLKQVEPNADWYLHHSKKMLICGGERTADVRTSKLSLEWIVDALTPNYVRQQRY